jgi:RNAse (barnase) inhibitor barstar
MFRFLFYICLPLYVFATPNWFYNIEEKDHNVILGYGSDKNLAVAKQQAMDEISKTISVSVQSNLNINKTSNELGYSSSIDQNINTSTQVNLTGVEFIKTKKLDDIWYIAAKYDNSPLDLKVKKTIDMDMEDEEQNNYLAKTELIKRINETLEKKLDYEIIRKDDLWNLKYKSKMFPLNQKEFYKLFSNTKSSSLEIKPNLKTYNRYDKMYFDIKNQRNGYVSLLYVEHNGKVGVLLPNKKANDSFRYPSESSFDSFEVANPYHKTIYELYIAVFSEDELDLSAFEDVENEYLDNTNYKFGALLNILDRNSFSTYRIKIKK